MPNDNIEQTLQSRQQNYGDFSDNSEIAQELKDILRKSPQWNTLIWPHREALDVICSKMSRIVAGKNSHYRDNWHDIQGYAKLAEDRCKD